jgi:hypothetical protein
MKSLWVEDFYQYYNDFDYDVIDAKYEKGKNNVICIVKIIVNITK